MAGSEALTCLYPSVAYFLWLTTHLPSKIKPAVPSTISKDRETRFSLALPVLLPFSAVVPYLSPEHMAMT